MRISDWSSDVCSSDLDKSHRAGGSIRAVGRMPEDASSLARHREFGFFPPNSWRSKSPQKNCLLEIVMRSSSPVAEVTLAMGAKDGTFEYRNSFEIGRPQVRTPGH